MIDAANNPDHAVEWLCAQYPKLRQLLERVGVIVHGDPEFPDGFVDVDQLAEVVDVGSQDLLPSKAHHPGFVLLDQAKAFCVMSGGEQRTLRLVAVFATTERVPFQLRDAGGVDAEFLLPWWKLFGHVVAARIAAAEEGAAIMRRAVGAAGNSSAGDRLRIKVSLYDNLTGVDTPVFDTTIAKPAPAPTLLDLPPILGAAEVLRIEVQELPTEEAAGAIASGNESSAYSGPAVSRAVLQALTTVPSNVRQLEMRTGLHPDTLYVALADLEKAGRVVSGWTDGPEPRRRYYLLVDRSAPRPAPGTEGTR